MFTFLSASIFQFLRVFLFVFSVVGCWVIIPFMIPLDTALSYVTLNLKFFINLKVKHSNINLIQFV